MTPIPYLSPHRPLVEPNTHTPCSAQMPLRQSNDDSKQWTPKVTTRAHQVSYKTLVSVDIIGAPISRSDSRRESSKRISLRVRPSVRPYPIIIISLRVHTIRNRIKRKRKGKSFPQTTSTHPPTHPRCCWARFNLAYCIHSLLSQRLMQLTKKKNSEGDESLAINRSWHCSPQPGGGRRGGGLFDIAINKMERRRTSSSSSS